MKKRAIALINKSTLIKDADVKLWAAALQIQVSRDFAPAWRARWAACFPGLVMPVLDLTVCVGAVPGAEPLNILDDSDQAGALGYHDDPPGSRPAEGFVFARDTLDAGDAVSATVSHELLEMAGDPTAAAKVRALWNGRKTWFPPESCDPVENDEYAINGVKLSNFITPDWFNPKAPAGTKFDFLGKLTAPLTLSPGGYFLYSYDGRNWHQKFGRDVPKHQRIAHRFSRRHRRTKGLLMAAITTDQIAQLQTLVATLVTDKGVADEKTQASNDADAAAAQAASVAAQAKLEEVNADAQATADLTALQLFVDGLAAPAPAPAPVMPA